MNLLIKCIALCGRQREKRHMFCVFVFLFIWKSEWQQRVREREHQSYREREKARVTEREETQRDCSTVGFPPNGHSIQSWADSKPGDRSFFWVSHVDSRTHRIRLASSAFPGHKKETRMVVEQLVLELLTIWDARARRKGSACYATIPSPEPYILIPETRP